MKKITLLISLLILTGCGTFYGTSHVKKLSSNKFRILFEGNKKSTMDIAKDFALLRSAEITLKKGFRYFSITNIKFDSTDKTTATIAGYNTQTRNSTYLTSDDGGKTYYQKGYTYNTTTPLYAYHDVKNPKVIYQIICYKEKPRSNVWDAELVVNRIRRKYRID